MDESDDSRFYSFPRFVRHIDDRATAALEKYYGEVLPSPSTGPAILDLCSSWISMLPVAYKPSSCRLSIIGMNEEELRANPQASAWRRHDLNADPRLEEADASQDAVICSVSIDYMTKPRELVAEIARVLKPGSSAHFAFSNRCFPTKVVARWLQIDEEERCDMVGQYFHSSHFTDVEAVTVLEPSSQGDPLYVVRARRSATNGTSCRGASSGIAGRADVRLERRFDCRARRAEGDTTGGVG